MFCVKYRGHRYPLVFMLAEYLKFPVASLMLNAKFYIKFAEYLEDY